MLLKRLKQPGGKLFVLPVLLMLLLLPAKVLAQEARYSVKFEQGSLEQALGVLRSTTGVSIAFSKEEIKGVSVKATQYEHKTVEQILHGLLTDLPFTIEKRGTAWLVKKAPDKQEQPVPNKGPGQVKGKIIDEENGQPVIGATIRFGNKGTTSGADGSFHFSLPAGSYTATVTYVGYASREISGIEVTDNGTFPLEVILKRDKGQLGEVTIKADRVVTSTERRLINEIRTSTGVVSGISSEQITISVDRSASEVVRRVAGITLQDGFINIRGMTPRYNPVFLNNTYLPSTDPNKRAFNFDLLPSSVIDRIMVYKSAAPELPADFAGGVVKVYTKKSVPIRRFELSLNTQYRTGNKFFDNHTSSGGGKYDWLGYDDGTRAMPNNMPRNPYGEIILPDIVPLANNYKLANEVVTDALLERSKKAWNLRQTNHPVDMQADATYYTYANIGKMRLNSVTVGRYESQRLYFKTEVARNANRYRDTVFPKDGTPLTPFYQYNYRLSYDSVYSSQVRVAGMQHLSLIINPDHELTAMGLYNHNTKEVLQINTLREWFTESGASLFPRRFENAYNTQDLYLGMLGGTHKMGGNKHLLEWSGSYSKAYMKDPNQFSNSFDMDEDSYEGDKQGFGRLTITDSTLWKLNTGTRKNTVVGRFADAQGEEDRWQGNMDYTIKPLDNHADFLIRAGGYVESRKKNYFTSSLAFRDFPNMPFSKTPWETLGTDLGAALQQEGVRMHTGIQEVGVGLTQTSGYQAVFDNLAGYLATNIPLRFKSPFNNAKTMQLDIYGGVRIEYSERKVLTTSGEQILYEYRPNPSGQQEIAGYASPVHQTFVLPSATATLHVNDKWQIRASYGKTLNRPELRELSPYLTYNPAEGSTYIGKPTLHDARIHNIDLRLEWYPSEGEAISAGVYYKKMEEPIEETMALTNTGIPGYTHSNLPYSRIYGAEIEIRKKLDFIGGAIFKHMGIIANACYNHTTASNETWLAGQTVTNYFPGGTTRPFMGAAPWIVNAGLFYDNKATGSRFSLQYNVYGDRMLANTSGVIIALLEPWTFERSRNLMDISLLQKITNWVSIRVAAQNLLNSPIRQYVDGDFNQRYNANPTLFTWNVKTDNGQPLDLKYIQGDYYTRNYKPGVYYSVGFQFNL